MAPSWKEEIWMGTPRNICWWGPIRNWSTSGIIGRRTKPAEANPVWPILEEKEVEGYPIPIYKNIESNDPNIYH